MDPLTQGVVGAIVPQATAGKSRMIAAGFFGFVAGMTPDLDVLIRSETDPLLFLEYHRQFTHSLIFIPVGGLLCALVLHTILGRWMGLSFKRVWLFCSLGYGTHGLLDACTSYGTVLFWPFSDERFSWQVISVVDPLFTLPLLTLIVLAAVLRRPGFAHLAIVWAGVYLGTGYFQHQSAITAGLEIARERGHEPTRIEAKPSFANILVWKTVYETKDRFYVDAVRVGIAPVSYPGASIEKLDIERDFSWVNMSSQQARDIERFRWFSDGYVARDQNDPNRIIDVRYSVVPNEISALWSIVLDPSAGPLTHVQFEAHRGDVRAGFEKLKTMMFAP